MRNIRIHGAMSHWCEYGEYFFMDENNSDVQKVCDDIERILSCYNTWIKSGPILEIWAWYWGLTRALRNRWADIIWIDITPKWEWVIYWEIEDLPIETASKEVVISCSVFDEKVYRQNQEKMKQEIERVLSPGWLYLSYEVHRKNPITIPSMLSSQHPNPIPCTVFQKTLVS